MIKKAKILFISVSLMFAWNVSNATIYKWYCNDDNNGFPCNTNLNGVTNEPYFVGSTNIKSNKANDYQIACSSDMTNNPYSVTVQSKTSSGCLNPSYGYSDGALQLHVENIDNGNSYNFGIMSVDCTKPVGSNLSLIHI